VHAGGRHLRVSSPLDRVPLFVRHGALIATTAVHDTVGDGPFTEITLVSWGGVSAETIVSDVDGDTTIRAVRDGDTLRVSVDGPLPVGRVECAPVAGAAAPRTILIDRPPPPDPQDPDDLALIERIRPDCPSISARSSGS
jgi:alpha-D-xyloside xylohydrolase